MSHEVDNATSAGHILRLDSGDSLGYTFFDVSIPFGRNLEEVPGSEGLVMAITKKFRKLSD